MHTGPQLNRRRLLALCSSGVLLSACSAELSSTRRSESRPIDTRVALLAPLSGKHAGVGAQMAKAVWLVEDYGGATRKTQVLDAGETPQDAANAARAAIVQGANILVGPLLRDQTPAVVEAAESVPVLSLSNDAALAATGAWVFGVTPAQSAQTVLGYAKETGARRLAMLETSGTHGHQAMQALQAEAGKARVTVLPAIPGDTAPTDFSEALQRAGAGTMPDIVFVPGAGQATLRQAEAAVRAGVTTIGSLQWSGLAQPELDRLDKACFTGPDPVWFDRLSAFFRAHLDEDLGVIAALAIDAIGVAQAAGGGPSLSTRTAYEGLLGDTRFDRDGTLHRSLAILRIDNGTVRPVA